MMMIYFNPENTAYKKIELNAFHDDMDKLGVCYSVLHTSAINMTPIQIGELDYTIIYPLDNSNNLPLSLIVNQGSLPPKIKGNFLITRLDSKSSNIGLDKADLIYITKHTQILQHYATKKSIVDVSQIIKPKYVIQ